MNLFSKSDVMQLRAEIDQALAIIAQKHGLVISMGNGRFNPTEFRISKLTIRPKAMSIAAPVTSGTNAATLAQTPEGQEYLSLCYLSGLPKDGLGKTFIFLGKNFTITGLKRSRRKYPVSAVSTTGRRMKFTVQSVIAGLSMAAVAQSLVK